MAQRGLHLVFGGELKNLSTKEFVDPNNIDIVGIFPNYDQALSAWRAAAQSSVDQATVRYFIADLTKLRDPEVKG
ncbi:MAG: DUF4170 domain-containing protein [Alphaproteobacteria bacterium]|jgi:hypothetical protein|nr:DUF4170 domain-containing protein [Alphaproteobacteria bacterium]